MSYDQMNVTKIVRTRHRVTIFVGATRCQVMADLNWVPNDANIVDIVVPKDDGLLELIFEEERDCDV
jgi:hypothetical protein